MSPELTTQRVDETKRGVAERRTAKKSSEKVHRRRSVGEGLLELWQEKWAAGNEVCRRKRATSKEGYRRKSSRRRSAGKVPPKKAHRRRSTRDSSAGEVPREKRGKSLEKWAAIKRGPVESGQKSGSDTMCREK